MSVEEFSAPPGVEERPAYWGGVFAMSLCVFALIASEFMPVSLLTPIASDLSVTEGQAGQAIAISGAFAVLTSLVISFLAGQLDRKVLLLVLTGVMAVSGTIVAIAPNYELFMVGRALIGIVIGGFWSMSAAIAMRLVPEHHVPKALAIFNGGNALATVLAPPLGAFLGSIIGWRGAFFCVVPVAAIVFFWQMASLPAMKAERRSGSGNVFKLLRRPLVALGMASVGLFFMGQFALFTYVRPFLETVGGCHRRRAVRYQRLPKHLCLQRRPATGRCHSGRPDITPRHSGRLAASDANGSGEPASTFKIPLAAMAYDTNILADAHHPVMAFRRGDPDWGDNWKRDTDPASWLLCSVLWYLQRITHAMGAETLTRYARGFGYGNADFSDNPGFDNGLERAWVASSLKVSPQEQASFLRELLIGTLSVSPSAMEHTREIVERRSLEGWTIHGKTGAAYPRRAGRSFDYVKSGSVISAAW